MTSFPPLPDPFGLQRYPLGEEAHFARVLYPLPSSASIGAPTRTICALPDGRFALCEVEGGEAFVIGKPVALHDAIASAELLASNRADAASRMEASRLEASSLFAPSLHAAIGFLALIGGATQVRARVERTSGDPAVNHPIVVDFPSVRGAG